MTTATEQKQTLSFQTEVKQLLQLMIHSLYSNREIFLRELVSNASDAIDKLRFMAVTNSALNESATDLKIRVSVDKAAGTIPIADNGIGMSLDEVIATLCTISNSGTPHCFYTLPGHPHNHPDNIAQSRLGL